MKHYLLILILLIASIENIYSKEVIGKGKCIVNDNMTIMQAKGIALNNARKDAIEKFGFYIEYNSNYSTLENGKEFKDNYNDMISSQFAGLVDVKKTDYTKVVENGIIQINCDIILEIDEESFKQKMEEYLSAKNSKNSKNESLESLAFDVEKSKLELERERIELEKYKLELEKEKLKLDKKYIISKNEEQNRNIKETNPFSKESQIANKAKNSYVKENFEGDIRKPKMRIKKEIQQEEEINTNPIYKEKVIISQGSKIDHFISFGVEDMALSLDSDDNSDYKNFHKEEEDNEKTNYTTFITGGYNFRYYPNAQKNTYFTFGVKVGFGVVSGDEYNEYLNNKYLESAFSFDPYINWNYGFFNAGITYKYLGLSFKGSEQQYGFRHNYYNEYDEEFSYFTGYLGINLGVTLFDRLYFGIDIPIYTENLEVSENRSFVPSVNYIFRLDLKVN